MKDLISELGFYAAKQKWPKGLEDMPDLLKRAQAALSTDAEPMATYWKDATGGFHIDLNNPSDGIEPFDPKPLYAAPPAPSVAVKADLPERFEEWWTGRDSKGEKTLDYNQRKQLAWDAFYAAALSAQVQDVAKRTRRVERENACSCSPVSEKCVTATGIVTCNHCGNVNGRVIPAAPATKPEGIDRSKLRPIFDDAEGRN